MRTNASRIEDVSLSSLILPTTVAVFYEAVFFNSKNMIVFNVNSYRNCSSASAYVDNSFGRAFITRRFQFEFQFQDDI